ncbi:hypothetical protein POM88_049834 [Heracleum sosnowskyi]|uniref:Uncharacterized protein n=1 Tax=Heracleum sosnowskyi TaxID=360622 RepID=A0AAD8GYV5_9APIA|nr:hypothetical protein POM88_049834 [Heracleum sosnowskyi]
MNQSVAVADKSSLDQHKSGALPIAGKVTLDHDLGFYRKWKAFGHKIEADQKSAGSSENNQSLRSVVAVLRKWPISKAIHKDVKTKVHSRVLEIREEDAHIGEDVAVYLSTEKSSDCHYQNMDFWIYSDRPILPSPLGSKADKSVDH